MRRWLPPVAVGTVAAVLAWVALVLGAHLLQDHADHHLVLDLLKYNIQQGRLVPLSLGASDPPGASTGKQPGPPPPSRAPQ